MSDPTTRASLSGAEPLTQRVSNPQAAMGRYGSNTYTRLWPRRQTQSTAPVGGRAGDGAAADPAPAGGGAARTHASRTQPRQQPPSHRVLAKQPAPGGTAPCSGRGARQGCRAAPSRQHPCPLSSHPMWTARCRTERRWLVAHTVGGIYWINLMSSGKRSWGHSSHPCTLWSLIGLQLMSMWVGSRARVGWPPGSGSRSSASPLRGAAELCPGGAWSCCSLGTAGSSLRATAGDPALGTQSCCTATSSCSAGRPGSTRGRATPGTHKPRSPKLSFVESKLGSGKKQLKF